MLSSLSTWLFFKYFTLGPCPDLSGFPVKCRRGGSVPLWYGSSAGLFSCLLSSDDKSSGAQLCCLPQRHIYSSLWLLDLFNFWGFIDRYFLLKFLPDIN